MTPKHHSILRLALSLVATGTPALGEEYPLPYWGFFGGGNAGNWGGSSTGPDNVNLGANINQPIPGAYVTSYATSSESVLIISSNTTYSLRFAGAISGSASVAALFLGDSGTLVSTSVTGGSWRYYTNTFTTAGPGDARVGQNLFGQFVLTKSGALGTAIGTFTNIQLFVDTLKPTIGVQTDGAGHVQISWLTNYHWYTPETASNFSASAWSPVTNSPVIQSNQFVVHQSLEPGTHFYRLRQN